MEKFFEKLFGAVSDFNESANAARESAANLSDEQLQRRIMNEHNAVKKLGYMNAYKDRHSDN